MNFFPSIIFSLLHVFIPLNRALSWDEWMEEHKYFNVIILRPEGGIPFSQVKISILAEN